jgi:hypothetical protein
MGTLCFITPHEKTHQMASSCHYLEFCIQYKMTQIWSVKTCYKNHTHEWFEFMKKIGERKIR